MTASPPSPGLDEYGASLLAPLPWFDAGWWHNRAVSLAYRSTAVAPPAGDWPVMAHVLTQDTDAVTGALFGRYVPDGLQPGTAYVVSCWVWLDAAFRGALVGMVFDGFASSGMENASLLHPREWQRVWVRAPLPDGVSAANPRLYIIGQAGGLVYSSGWKLETG